MLYVANFHSGQIEVYNSSFQLVSEFTDPNWPNGYAPYNVQNIGGNLYVTFAKQNQAQTAAVPGLGNGFVDEFTPAGALIQRLITGAPLDAPWGVVMAPADFGQFSNDLLISNQGDGEVDAFNPTTGQFLGVFADNTGAPISNAGLNGLFIGVGGSLYFTAGPASGTRGLFGTLSPTPDTVTVAPATLAASITNVTAFVNQPFDGVVATFTDSNIYALPTDFTATVNWGDGTSDTSGDGNVTIVQSDGSGSSFIVQGSHTYTTSTTGYPPAFSQSPSRITSRAARSSLKEPRRFPTRPSTCRSARSPRSRMSPTRGPSRRSPTTCPTQTSPIIRRPSIGAMAHRRPGRSLWRTRPARDTS